MYNHIDLELPFGLVSYMRLRLNCQQIWSRILGLIWRILRSNFFMKSLVIWEWHKCWQIKALYTSKLTCWLRRDCQFIQEYNEWFENQQLSKFWTFFCSNSILEDSGNQKHMNHSTNLRLKAPTLAMFEQWGHAALWFSMAHFIGKRSCQMKLITWQALCSSKSFHLLWMILYLYGIWLTWCATTEQIQLSSWFSMIIKIQCL